MCHKSESMVNLAKALMSFHSEVEKIEKDATNPHFKNAYSTLDNMIDHTKPILAKHGLSVLQFPGGDGEKITVRTMIMHVSGEWIESEPLTLRADKITAQGAGSAITYGRRYSYAAALSLSLGDDDDGQTASASQTSQRPSQTTQQSGQTQYSGQQQNASQGSTNGVKMISDAQVGLIKKLVNEKKVPDEEYRLMIAPKASTKELTSQEASAVIKSLNEWNPPQVIDISDDDLPF